MSHSIVSKIAKKYGCPTPHYKLATILIFVLLISLAITFYIESSILTTIASETFVVSVFLSLLNFVAGPSSTRGLVVASSLMGVLIGSIVVLMV